MKNTKDINIKNPKINEIIIIKCFENAIDLNKVNIEELGKKIKEQDGDS
jgi:hypothetical protein